MQLSLNPIVKVSTCLIFCFFTRAARDELSYPPLKERAIVPDSTSSFSIALLSNSSAWVIIVDSFWEIFFSL